MSLFRKTEAHLGVDIGAGGIKLVELHKTKGRPQLWTYGIAEEPLDIHIEHHEKTPEDLLLEKKEKENIGSSGVIKPKKAIIQLDDPRVERYAKLLKDLAKSSRVTTNRATASLPVSYIFHSVLTMPWIEEKKRDAIVRAEIAKIMPRPIEEMQVVYQEIPALAETDPKSKYIKLLVTAAPKDLVAFYTAIFQKAGLQLEELETEAFALERSLVGRDKAVVMVVDIGSERTNFFIIDLGLPVIHRSIQEGGNNIDVALTRLLGLKPEHIEQVKRDMSLLPEGTVNADLFEFITDPIVKEIQYGFDLYMKQTGNEEKKPEKIILTGGSAFFPPIFQKIQANFNLKVFVGDPWGRVVYQQGLKPVLDEIGPRMAVSIGLALRNIL